MHNLSWIGFEIFIFHILNFKYLMENIFPATETKSLKLPLLFPPKNKKL